MASSTPTFVPETGGEVSSDASNIESGVCHNYSGDWCHWYWQVNSN